MGFDYLIRNGFIINGRDKDSLPEKADIAIKDACIQEIGNFAHIAADKIIDAKELCICPGFIDVHAHSEFTLLADGRAEGKIRQGVTTEINGNCGLSAAPLFGPALEQREKELAELDIRERWNTFQEYFVLLERKGCAVNFVTLAGHGNLRASAAGYSDKPLSETERMKMCAYLGDAMTAGAKGLSTGLIYPPGIFSETNELVELAQEIKKYNGIYTTHMRSESDMLLEAVDEVITIAAQSGVQAHISHLKTGSERNWKKLKDVFEKIETAQQNGISLTCDRYPYIASGTDLDAILPSWAFEGGHKKELERLVHERKMLADAVLSEHPVESYWEKIMISSVMTARNKWMEGKTLLSVSSISAKPPVEMLLDILIEEELQVAAIFFSMNEDNLQAILKKPYTVIGSDSSARSFDGITAKGKPHPRGFGSFPRVLGKYTRELGVLTLSEAIYRMTGLPAKIFKIGQRGIIAKGCFADLVVFDPEKIQDRAEFNDPFQKPEGIHHVFVNGIPVLLDGEVTGALPGHILR
ncbi:MAG: D-aminoacylase [Nitrospiraceae bacterium]|nr:MAG: D-aminoacylase [Nitrospiraceae bacterium]